MGALGGSYFYDFVTGNRLPNIETVARAIASLEPPEEKPRSLKKPTRAPADSRSKRNKDLMGEEAAAAAVAAAKAAAAAEARRADRKRTSATASVGGSAVGSLVSSSPRALRWLFSVAAALVYASVRSEDTMRLPARLRLRSLKAIRAKYGIGIAASLAHGPRPLLHTLEVGRAYGISLQREADLLFLADLALSLPIPAGWVHIAKPHSGGFA